MDFYFQKYYQQIGDSMTEQQYAWKILAPLVDKINCGHTSVSLSKAYAKWADGRRFPAFPLTLKVWNDSMAVIGNMNRKDSIFKRGTLVKSVNGLSTSELVNNIFGYLPQDGYANNINYIRMSANFPYYHRNIYGLSKDYQVTYLDKEGNEKTATIPVYTPPKDSARKKDSLLPKPIKLPKPTREERLQAYRSLKIDSSGKYAILNLNTFSKGHLRRFFRRSFRELKEKNIQNLVLDLRNNGGGRVGVSTLLTKYISRHPFKVADTLYQCYQKPGAVYTLHQREIPQQH
ncbi:MAG: S41 family peptidase [Ferruginibacter sp.]